MEFYTVFTFYVYVTVEKGGRKEVTVVTIFFVHDH